MESTGPSNRVVGVGKGEDQLVHEANFEDGIEKDAKSSTNSEGDKCCFYCFDTLYEWLNIS